MGSLVRTLLIQVQKTKVSVSLYGASTRCTALVHADELLDRPVPFVAFA